MSLFLIYEIKEAPNWKETVSKQLNLLSLFQLGSACAKIFIYLPAPLAKEAKQLWDRYPFSKKIKTETATTPLQKAFQVAKENTNAFILHFHSLFEADFDQHDRIQKRNLQKQLDFINYFTLIQWKTCVQSLIVSDVCGVNWVSLEDGGYFHENVWWVRSKYLNTCDQNTPNTQLFANGHPKVCHLMSALHNPRLYRFFSPEEIGQRQHPYHYGCFNWCDYYYDDSYYWDESAYGNIEEQVIEALRCIEQNINLSGSIRLIKKRISQGDITHTDIRKLIRSELYQKQLLDYYIEHLSKIKTISWKGKFY